MSDKDRASSQHSPESEGRLIVIFGPSGVGKTTIIERVAELLPLRFSVSATTRPPRPDERDGVDYHFIDEEEFLKRVDGGDFLEWATYSSHLYGTPASTVRQGLAEGEDVLLDIEIQGARQVRAAIPKAILIFVAPPSLQTLRRRLEQRADTSTDQVEQRLEIARTELAEAPGLADHIITNESVEEAVSVIAGILSHGG